MDLLLAPLGDAFFIRALVALALVGVVCAVVGTFVVVRGIAFIGDAIAHAGFPGVVVAYIIGIPFYIGAAVAAVATALAIGWVTKRAGLRQDTSIGVLFAGTFALGVFLFSSIDGYVSDLFSFLFGNVLAIGVEDLIALVLLGGGVILTIAVLWKELARLHPDKEQNLNWARGLVEHIRQRAGLLMEREPGVFTFPHRTFQEYLAGVHVAVGKNFGSLVIRVVRILLIYK